MKFVVRCRYIASGGEPEGVGYLDSCGRCTSDRRDAQMFETEDEAWTFAANSCEDVPGDAWAEAAA